MGASRRLSALAEGTRTWAVRFGARRPAVQRGLRPLARADPRANTSRTLVAGASSRARYESGREHPEAGPPRSITEAAIQSCEAGALPVSQLQIGGVIGGQRVLAGQNLEPSRRVQA